MIVTIVCISVFLLPTLSVLTENTEVRLLCLILEKRTMTVCIVTHSSRFLRILHAFMFVCMCAYAYNYLIFKKQQVLYSQTYSTLFSIKYFRNGGKLTVIGSYVLIYFVIPFLGFPTVLLPSPFQYILNFLLSPFKTVSSFLPHFFHLCSVHWWSKFVYFSLMLYIYVYMYFPFPTIRNNSVLK